MRVAGKDELVDAELVVPGDPVGDPLVAADQGGARATAHQADAGPQIRRYLQGVSPAAVQCRHPALALGLGGALDCLGALDRGRVEAVEQPTGLRPCLAGALARDHVQPDAEA